MICCTVKNVRVYFNVDMFKKENTSQVEKLVSDPIDGNTKT